VKVVLDVIENGSGGGTDKNQNLKYSKDKYNRVCRSAVTILIAFSAFHSSCNSTHIHSLSIGPSSSTQTTRKVLLETFLSPTYLNMIKMSAPWILRIPARIRNVIREVKIIQTEDYQYQKPVMQFYEKSLR